MKKLLFFVLPVFLGFLAFFIATFILSQQSSGVGALQVTASPQSNVFLNNKLIGQTPLCKCSGKDMLPTGDYTIRLVPLDGSLSSQPFEQKITIMKSVLTVVDRTFGQGATSEGSVITLSPLSSANTTSGKLQINTFPSGAAVNVDGNSVGTTPLTIPSVVESDHDLTLSKPGYSDKTIRIHTINGYLLSVIAFLAINPNAASASSSAQIASESALPTVAKVIILDTPTGYLNVRKDPSLGAAVLAQVKPGYTYDFIAEQADWTEIKLTNGTEGWVSSSYVKKQ